MIPQTTLSDATRATRRQARPHTVPTGKIDAVAFRVNSAKALAEYEQIKARKAAELRTLTGTIPAGVYGQVAP